MSFSKEKLVLFGIFSLHSEGGKCSFEKMVEKSFSLFPEVFSLQDFPNWPDTRKFDRTLRRLKGEKLLSFKNGIFLLTPKGKKEALEVSLHMKQERLKI